MQPKRIKSFHHSRPLLTRGRCEASGEGTAGEGGGYAKALRRRDPASLARANDWKWNEMELNGTELEVCRPYPLLRAVPRRGWLPRLRVGKVPSVVPVNPANLASLSRPQPPHVPGRSAQQSTSTRQFTVANMSQNEYDDSNAAAKTRFRPPACVTHLHTSPRFLQAWRGLLLPGPIPGVAKVHHRSLSPSQRLSPGGGATDPGFCLSPSPVYERNETK